MPSRTDFQAASYASSVMLLASVSRASSARDFRALMLKYGRIALFDGLSGTSRQVASPHEAAAAADEAIAAAARPAPRAETTAAPRRRRASTALSDMEATAIHR